MGAYLSRQWAEVQHVPRAVVVEYLELGGWTVRERFMDGCVEWVVPGGRMLRDRCLDNRWRDLDEHRRLPDLVSVVRQIATAEGRKEIDVAEDLGMLVGKAPRGRGELFARCPLSRVVRARGGGR